MNKFIKEAEKILARWDKIILSDISLEKYKELRLDLIASALKDMYERGRNDCEDEYNDDEW